MFHSSTLSPRSPLTNPREKYLAALAEAKAAEAEYLAAERLQQEEDSLRQRLEQIQLLKHNNTPRSDLGSYYAPAQYPQSAPLDIDLLRRQIAAEERARITREQQQARELEAFRKQQALELEKQQARELEALRIHEARKAQLARDNERTRSLAAQRARLAALTQQASEPAVRFVISGDSAPARRNHCRPHHARRPEFHNTVDLTPYFAAAPRAVDPNEAFQTLFKAQKETKPESTLNSQDFLHLLFGGRAEEQSKAPEAPQVNNLPEALSHLLRGAQPSTTPKATAQAQQPELNPEDFLKLLFGGRVEERSKAPAPTPAPAAAPKTDIKPQQPAKETAPQVVTLEQLINHFLGAVGVEQAQPSTSSAAPQEPKAQPSEKKEAAPTPVPASAPKPAAPSSVPQAVGLEQVLSQFLGGSGAHPSASSPVDFQQLMNMFMGGHAHAQAPKAPEASSSKSASSTDSPLKTELETRLRSQQSSEERDLEEAIRMSLAEATANPPPASPSEAKGKAPAPAPVKDVTTSTAEVTAIDASFAALAADFAFPATLDFSTSRASSPTRTSNESSGGAAAVARLSYSAQNQGVRVYHQALSGLLGRLDAVESFGDEGLRHARKEVVGRVEGALDELEQIIEARWRKFAGREERVESTPAPVESAPVTAESSPAPAPVESAPAPVESIPSAEEEAPVVAEEVQEDEIEVVDLKTDVQESTTSTATESSYPPAADSSSYPPAAESSSYPPAAAESSSYPPAIVDSASVETLRPSPSPSPAPSDVDTFLLPGVSHSDEVPQKKSKRSEEEEVGSDWSEVEA